MPDIASDETRLAAEIERLKADFPKTRALCREACALLFFRFGITPTANRLYQRRALEADIERLQTNNTEGDRALALARADFTAQLDRLRDDANRAEERLRASEKRALQEIDRERTAAARLQKELDATAARAEKRDAQHRGDVAALQAQLGDSLHRCGVLQGQLDGASAANAAYGNELDTLRREMAALAAPRRAPARPAKAAASAQAVRKRRAARPGPGASSE
ncbi:hypothetical protein [Burkholderia stagnalis]|uniref:ATPase n=1 Tax=Burkholderia stagnalis TaxID=1503054 RepID=A0A108IBR4_9BURK|nr:hypothetical protein [Burkholderia stagnalis]KVZ16053.1 hypothetical protein WT35_10100 [Burkholderia stagnalis]KWA44416.1 hypothetical protein WT42_30515 [Burkholderia stagnalis]KWA58125.1 hypothetical protein WT43_20120 [Burkholderia stagnalis]KWA62496.1 hypothetical protein WT44_14535 [Burkholderia stagnalis]KWC90301.1 hypothetical protein WT45_33155 [Burkholderia stagnalis]